MNVKGKFQFYYRKHFGFESLTWEIYKKHCSVKISVCLWGYNNKWFHCKMTPTMAILGLIVFLWMLPNSEQHLNLYMDKKETYRLLGKLGQNRNFFSKPGNQWSMKFWFWRGQVSRQFDFKLICVKCYFISLIYQI